MEPIVEFTEYPDYEAYRAFYYFYNRRRPMAWVSWFMYYALFPVALLLFALAAFFTEVPTSLWLLAPIWLAGMIANATAPRRGFKQLHGKSSTVTCTAFFEDYFAYTATGENTSRSGSFRYENVVAAYETAIAFYFNYTDKNWGFLPKKFLAPGQAEALRDLLARKFGERFNSKI